MESPLVARIYERYWRPALVHLVARFRYADEDAIVDRYLNAGGRLKVLDLCCGTARASRRLTNPTAQVLGIDRSLAMLREARRLSPQEGVILVRGDAASRLPMAGTFDAAICFASLHLLRKPRGVMETAAQALRHGGMLFAWVVTSTGPLSSAGMRRLADRIGLRAFEPGALEAETAACGIGTIKVITSGAIEFIVARRS